MRTLRKRIGYWLLDRTTEAPMRFDECVDERPLWRPGIPQWLRGLIVRCCLGY